MARAATTRPTSWSAPPRRPTATPATSPATRYGPAPRCTATPTSRRSAPPATPASNPRTSTHGQTTCEGCHKSTSTWSAGKVDHATFNAATNCASCHNGSGGVTGKNSSHVPVGSTNCFACHSPTQPWKPSGFNHTQVTVTAQCATCHTGTYQAADGKGTNHTPYQLVSATSSANCDTCHKSGYAVWTGAKVHSNANITAQCATCHAGIKPNNAVHTARPFARAATSPPAPGPLARSTTPPSTRPPTAPLPQRHGGVTGKNSHTRAGGQHQLLRLPQPYPTPGSPAASTTRRSPSRPSAPPATPAPTRRPMARVPPHALSAGQRHFIGQLRHLPQVRLHAVDGRQGARQRHHHGAVRHLPRQHQAQQRHARRPDHLRDLSQVHQHLVRRQGRPHHVRRGHQLCSVPQRHRRRHRQEQPRTYRWAAPTATPATAPPRVEAQPLQPHPGAGDGAVRHLPHRQLPGGRWQAASHTPYQLVQCHRFGQLRRLPQGGLHAVDAAPSCTATSRHGAVRHLPRQRQTQQHHARRPDGCEGCHKSTSTWSGAKVDHTTFTAATNCASVPQRHRRRHRQEQPRTYRWAAPTATPATAPPRPGSPAASTTRRCR
jgi:hypothetical protein